MRKMFDIIDEIKNEKNTSKISAYLYDKGINYVVVKTDILFPDQLEFCSNYCKYPLIATTWDRVLFKILDEYFEEHTEDISVDDKFIQLIADKIYERLVTIFNMV